MRTNVLLDDVIMGKAQKLAKAKTKRETIDIALREYVANHSRKDLRELAGKLEFWEDYDYKAMREGQSCTW
jgi:Arc/MetJ family transcription regulator